MGNQLGTTVKNRIRIKYCAGMSASVGTEREVSERSSQPLIDHTRHVLSCNDVGLDQKACAQRSLPSRHTFMYAVLLAEFDR